MLAATKRVRLSYEELYQLKALIGGALTLISLWTLFYLDVRSGPLLLLTSAAVVAVTLFPRLPGRIPGVVWVAATPSLITVIVVDFVISRPDIIAPLLRMVVLLVLMRSLQSRRRREDLQLILLCLFMVVVSGVLTLSLTFALQILVFTPCAIALLFVINLTESFDRPNEIPEGLWSGFTWRHFLGRIYRVFDVRLSAFAVFLFLGVVVVSSLIFVLMPRFRLDQAIPFLNLKGKARSGFTDQISFGDIVEIIEDNSVALRVDLPEGLDEVPVNPYWRMVVLDEYFNRSFRMSYSAKRENRPFSDNVFSMQRIGPRQVQRSDGNSGSWTFYLEGGISKYLPAVGLFDNLRFQNRQDVVFNYILHLNSTSSISSGVLFYQMDGMSPMHAYPVTPEERKELPGLQPVFLESDDGLAGSRVPYPETTMVVPGGDANLRILNRILSEITRGETLGTDEFCQRAVDYLRDRHGYSLSVSLPPGEADELVRWMGSSVPGHCELFAGSFTLLARLAGIPTRVVTGFKGGTWSGFENYYMVRNRDAHAWCEVYDGKKDWVRVDPTPGSGPAGLESAVTASFGQLNIDKSWRAYLDSLRILWYRRIVNFDRDQQTAVASYMKSAGSEFLETLRLLLQERTLAFRNWLRQPWTGGHWEKVGLFAVGAAFFFLLFRYAHLWIPKVTSEARVFGIDFSGDPVRKRAGRLVRKFRTRSAALDALDPSVAPEEWQQAYRLLLALRFGDSRDRPNPKPVFRQARRLLKRYTG